MPKLRELNLSSNQLGDASLTAISAGFANGALSSLKVLYVNDNQIGAKGFKAFAKAVSKAGRKVALRQLYMQNNQANNAGIAAMTAALSGKSISEDAGAGGGSAVEEARASLGEDFVQDSLSDPVVRDLMPSYLNEDVAAEETDAGRESRSAKSTKPSFKLSKLTELYLDGNGASETVTKAAKAAMQERSLVGDV